MAKTIQQAEAELRTAALEYAAAYEVYRSAWDQHGDHNRYKSDPPAPLHPETDAAVKFSVEKQSALTDAARELGNAVRNEQRAEAL